MKPQYTPLNPRFADIPTSELISRLEAICVFKSAELEHELTARLERVGKHWRFVGAAKIETHCRSTQRPPQHPCDIGLFDVDGRRQTDMADL